MFIVDYLFLVLGRFVFYLLRRIGFKIDLDKNSNYEDSMLTLAGFLLFCLIGFVIYFIYSKRNSKLQNGGYGETFKAEKIPLEDIDIDIDNKK